MKKKILKITKNLQVDDPDEIKRAKVYQMLDSMLEMGVEKEWNKEQKQVINEIAYRTKDLLIASAIYNVEREDILEIKQLGELFYGRYLKAKAKGKKRNGY